MIRLENVTYKRERVIFNDVSLHIKKNCITVVIGANGSGKTTLANLICGLAFPQSGKIFLDDVRLDKKTKQRAVRKKIGMVFQNPSNQILFPKVYDDIEFSLENMGYSEEIIPGLIMDSLKKVGMANFAKENPYKLSGGQKQRVALASQLSYSPDYLVFDEATSMIDANGKAAIHALIGKLKRKTGIIYITNDMSELIYADEIVIIDGGEIYTYIPKDILQDERILESHGLVAPFILKMAGVLQIKEPSEIREGFILERVSGLV